MQPCCGSTASSGPTADLIPDSGKLTPEYIGGLIARNDTLQIHPRKFVCPFLNGALMKAISADLISIQAQSANDSRAHAVGGGSSSRRRRQHQAALRAGMRGRTTLGRIRHASAM